MFQVKGGNVSFYDINFIGQKENVEWTNGQGSFIECDFNVDYTLVENCTFTNGQGFSIHAFSGYKTIVKNCFFINCGNGLNVNTSFCELVSNYFNNSEGIETSSDNGYIAYNTIDNALCVGISLGGNTSLTSRITNILCEHNTINGVTECNSHGIILADGLLNTIVRNNKIDNVNGYGIVTTLTVDNTFLENSLIEYNEINNATTYGIILQYSNRINGSILRNNVVRNITAFGFYIAEPNSIIENNDLLNSGVLYDLAYSENAIGATNINNLYNTFLDER